MAKAAGKSARTRPRDRPKGCAVGPGHGPGQRERREGPREWPEKRLWIVATLKPGTSQVPRAAVAAAMARAGRCGGTRSVRRGQSTSTARVRAPIRTSGQRVVGRARTRTSSRSRKCSGISGTVRPSEIPHLQQPDHQRDAGGEPGGDGIRHELDEAAHAGHRHGDEQEPGQERGQEQASDAEGVSHRRQHDHERGGRSGDLHPRAADQGDQAPATTAV